MDRPPDCVDERRLAYLTALLLAADLYAFAQEEASLFGLTPEQLVDDGRMLWLKANALGIAEVHDIWTFILERESPELARAAMRAATQRSTSTANSFANHESDPTMPAREQQRSEPVIISEVVFPEHTNHYGTMFGGHAFAMMDKAAFLAANRFSRSLVVTASSESVDFTVPIRVGMILEAVARVIHVSRTSMVVRVALNCRDLLSPEEREATTGYFTMVAVDADGKPVEIPGLIVEDQTEWEHAERIRAAAKARRRR